MNLPQPGDFIDIHTHDSVCSDGIFAVENIMAHEGPVPQNLSVVAFTAGIHPWHLNEDNRDKLLEFICAIAANPGLIAFGEAGFDRLRGPSIDLQKSVFADQVKIAVENKKPLIIHCVRAWDELLAAHKSLKPLTPWMVHGFRGKKELALQLIKRGMYLSFWFDFVMRPESAELLRYLPKDRIFLETDGAEVDIKDIYKKVSDDLAVSIDELKGIILYNYKQLFR